MAEETYKPMNKTMLADAYGVSVQTLNKWLEMVPELEVRKGQRLFTPKQIRLISEHIGKWE